MKLKEIFKRRNKEEESNLVVLWKSNKITDEELIKRYAVGFLGASVYYYAFFDDARERIMEHNKKSKSYISMIDRLLTGVPYDCMNLDKMLLEIHKRDKDEILDILINDRFIDVMGGMSTIMGMRECDDHKSCELLTKDSLIEECITPEVISLFKEQEKGLPFENRRIPTKEELIFFYDACFEAVQISEIAETQKIPFLPELIFSPKGEFLMRTDDGHQVSAEEDLMAQYIELDYRGVLNGQ